MAASESTFTHLHNHTSFSLLDGATRVQPLMARCVELGMSAIALTDHGNMFGAIQFYRAALDHGLKPILGMEAYLAPGDRADRSAARGVDEYAYHQLVLARDLVGYKNLMKLSSIGYLEGFYYRPRVDLESLSSHAEGLIATTGCLSSKVCQRLLHDDRDGARKAVSELIDILGRENVYVELQDQGLDEQRRVNPELVLLAREFRLRLVGTNDCHYLRKRDASAHDVLLCIQTGKGITDQDRMKFPNEEFYVKSPEEMARVFKEVPEALTTTQEIVERCNLELDFGKMHLPRFPVPEGYSLDEYFKRIVREGFERRLSEIKERGGELTLDLYEQRLDYEISVISSMGFAGYFLIVWDFIRYARERGIPVGPGRGSAAGSLVSYSLEITDLDPLAYGLVFERFLNPERISMPDIDIDFCMRRRGEVIEYVANKYGRDKVAHIITFGTMAAKAAIRDVGRALEMPYGDVDKIARMIPTELDVTIEDATRSVPALAEAIAADERVVNLVGLAKELEGQIRHASTHAAGVVIADEPLTDYVPLYKPSSGQGADQSHFVATQYAMNDVEAIGLLKMDFLGLRTLTLVHDTLASISRAQGSEYNTADISLDDKKTYDLFAQGATSGIFQFESSGMREALRKLLPARLTDLIAMNALYRPGPIRSGMIDEYCRRKHDPSKVEFEGPELQEILSETYGVILYQEQVMEIASALAGFSLGQADVLRKAMGKKKPEVMASQQEAFLTGCNARGVAHFQAKKIWDMIVEFAGYGFNKSHSAAYALLAYQTGFLKANYPVHFMAALLSTERDNTDRVVQYINECREMEISVLPPDINESHVSFTPLGDAIRFGLAAIKGVGETAVLAILDAREELCGFEDLYQFCEEVDLTRGINKRTVESLIKAGAFDSVGDDRCCVGEVRAQLVACLDRALESGQRRQRERSLGQANLFKDLGAHKAVEMVTQVEPPSANWSEREVLAAEKEALGFYITGHPLQRFADKVAAHANTSTLLLGQIERAKEVSFAGIVASRRDLKTRAGERMAVVQVEDLEGRAEVVVFPDLYRRCYELLQEDTPVLIRGRAQPNEDSARMVAGEIQHLAGVESKVVRGDARAIEIEVDLDQVDEKLPERIRATLEEHRGHVPVTLRLKQVQPPGFRCKVMPNRYLFVDPEKGLIEELEQLVGEGSVRLLV